MRSFLVGMIAAAGLALAACGEPARPADAQAAQAQAAAPKTGAAAPAATVTDAPAAGGAAMGEAGPTAESAAASAAGTPSGASGAAAGPPNASPGPTAAGQGSAAGAATTGSATAPAPSGASAATSGEPAPVTGDATPATQQSAEAIVEKAAAAYRDVKSLQADFTQQLHNPLLGDSHTSSGTLYQRRPDRFLMKFTQPAGDVIVSDGHYFWVYYPSVDEKQVIRAPAATGAGGVDLQAQFLGDPAHRFDSRLVGHEKVGGRDADVVLMTPKASSAGYRSIRVWVDRRDHLARRFELTEENGTVRRFDLSNLRVNAPVSAELFHFTPPPGAKIIDRG